MITKLKWIVFFETAAIMLLAIATVNFYIKSHETRTQDYYNGLLSSSIYSGAISPQSFTIFNFRPLEESFRSYIKDHNLDVSIYVENLRNENNFAINGNIGTYPASLNKLPVAILIMNKIERKELSFDTSITIDKSLLDNYSDELYLKNDKLPVKLLLERMLKESDNNAFQILIKNINLGDLTALMDYYDMDTKNTYFYSGEDLRNDTLLTSRSFANMFLSLYFSTILQEKDSEYLLGLLTNTSFDVKNIARLPDNVVVAQKYGDYYENGGQILNDCGIMYISKTGRILYCVSIRGQSYENSLGLLGGIVNGIHTYYTEKKVELQALKQNITTVPKS